MKRPKAGLIVIDLIILSGSYVFMAGLKPVMVSYLSPGYHRNIERKGLEIQHLKERESRLPDPQHYQPEPGGDCLHSLYYLRF